MGDALRIEIDAATGHVFMIGPAVEVLQGEIALADRERSFNKMQIRTAVPTDLQEIVKIEAECFPAAEAATKVSIAERLAVYPNHFWVQLDGDRMIGFVNGMVTDDPDLRDEMYEDASLHNENGAWQMIFGVDTIPEYRCRGCAAALLNRRSESTGEKGTCTHLQRQTGALLRQVWFCERGCFWFYSRKCGLVPDAAALLMDLGRMIWFSLCEP